MKKFKYYSIILFLVLQSCNRMNLDNKSIKSINISVFEYQYNSNSFDSYIEKKYLITNQDSIKYITNLFKYSFSSTVFVFTKKNVVNINYQNNILPISINNNTFCINNRFCYKKSIEKKITNYINHVN